MHSGAGAVKLLLCKKACYKPPQEAILVVGGRVMTIVLTPYDENKDTQEKITTQVLIGEL